MIPLLLFTGGLGKFVTVTNFPKPPVNKSREIIWLQLLQFHSCLQTFIYSFFQSVLLYPAVVAILDSTKKTIYFL
jgi:hypothetical protein